MVGLQISCAPHALLWRALHNMCASRFAQSKAQACGSMAFLIWNISINKNCYISCPAMPNIIIDINKYVVYRHISTSSLIAFDFDQAVKIRQLLSKTSKIFNQISSEEKMSGQLLEKNENGNFVLSGNYEVVKIQDLDHLPLSTRILLDFKKFFGIKP
jgi:hypothetical protein